MNKRARVVMGPQLTGPSKINARQEEEVEEEKKENQEVAGGAAWPPDP